MNFTRVVAVISALSLVQLTSPCLADSAKPYAAPGGIGGTGHSGRPDLPEMPDIPDRIDLPEQPDMPDFVDQMGAPDSTTGLPEPPPVPEQELPDKPDNR